MMGRFVTALQSNQDLSRRDNEQEHQGILGTDGNPQRNSQDEGKDMNRIEVYKLIAQVLLTRQYHLEEMQHIGPILDYLKQEIEAHVSTETSQDPGPQS